MDAFRACLGGHIRREVGATQWGSVAGAMCPLRVSAVTAVLTFVAQYSADAAAPHSPPVTPPRTGVCGVPPRIVSDGHDRGSDRTQSADVTACHHLTHSATRQGGQRRHNSLTECQFASAVAGLVEEYVRHLDVGYVNFILRDPPLARAVCRSVSWHLLAGRRRAVRLTCGHGAWRSSQQRRVLRGLTVAVLLPTGWLRQVLWNSGGPERLLVVARDPPRPLPDAPANAAWMHARLDPVGGGSRD
ncbi:uncharacterized protein LOC122384397 [Amphibalanus amphitrite]|uniref:uncharacterized protein LOC122384397 n=1 Tax=Amphibalanus amphitrite TaxID=1232801 RepID=UPI001C90D91F|nr:uncharacterized protein LOC122384397 [Amphibalanus amphitrite]